MMSDREILSFISKSSNNICGRIANDQLERPISIPGSAPVFPRKYLWRLFVPASLLAGKANAQQKKIKLNSSKSYFLTSLSESAIRDTSFVTMGYTVTAEIKKSDIIRGNVFDSITNEPLKGVSVKIVGTNKVAVAWDGDFYFEKVKNENDIELEFSAVSYKKTVLTLPKISDWTHLKIPMVPEAEQLQPVTVVAYPSSRQKAIGGAMSVIYTSTIIEKVLRSVADTLSISAFRSVKVYPNPVVRGNSMNLELSLKETGDYKLEILDMSGRVVLVQPLPVNEKKQTSQISTSNAWSSGIYWLRITGQHTKSIYQSKILLQ